MTATTPEPSPVTGNEGFVEVYSTDTGRKQTVPRHFVGDPILGRNLRLTPTQREFDGLLPERPTQASKVADIDAYATAAGIDFPTGADKNDKLAALEDAFAHSDEQAGMGQVDPDPVVPDPLAPELAAHVDADPTGAAPVTAPASGDTTTPPDDTTESSTSTPAAGDEEN